MTERTIPTQQTGEAELSAIGAVRGGTATILGQVAKMVISVLGLAVLSRLLDPADFGLVAIVQVLFAFGILLRNFGLGQASIQADYLSDDQASALFWLNIGVGAVLSIAMVPVGLILPRIFGPNELTAIAIVLGFTFVLGGAETQFRVRLIRQYRYRAIATMEAIAQALGLAAAIASAAGGLGYWALVAQQLVLATTQLGFFMLASRWHPRRFQRGTGVRSLVTYGAELGGAHFLNFLSTNADTLVIGSRLGASVLGSYNRAYQLLTAPMNQVLGPLSNIAVPILARSRHDRERFSRRLRLTQLASALPSVWLVSIAGGLASPAVALVLGAGWSSTALYFEILAIGGIFQQLSTTNYWMFLALARTRDLLLVNLVTKPATIVAIVFGARWGAQGVATAVTSSLAGSWILSTALLMHQEPLATSGLAVRSARLLAAGCAGYGAARLSGEVVSHAGKAAQLPVGAVLGTAAFLACTAATRSGRADLALLGQQRVHIGPQRRS